MRVLLWLACGAVCFAQETFSGSAVLDAAVDPLMKPWDVAPIVPCIVEAGGVISDLQGQTADMIGLGSTVAASNEGLRRQICRAIPRRS